MSNLYCFPSSKTLAAFKLPQHHPVTTTSCRLFPNYFTIIYRAIHIAIAVPGMPSSPRSPAPTRSPSRRSPNVSRGRSPSRSQTRSRANSENSASRSPRRSISPRSRSASDSRSRSRGPRSASPRRNGRRRSYSRTRSVSRSRSRSLTPRGRRGSYSRSAGRMSLSPAPRSAKIIVEQLTKNVNEDHLHEIFGHYGPIKDLQLPLNPAFRVNRGTAFIVYDEIEDAEKAIASMHLAELDGSKLQVSIVLPRRRFSRSPPSMRRNGPPPRARGDFGDGYRPGGPPGGYRPPPMGGGGGPPRYRSQSPGSYRGGHGGRGGRGNRGDHSYRPRRSATRSRSPRRSLSRTPYSRSPSRGPARHGGGGGGYRRRDSPPRRGSGGGRSRRSPSYSSYDSYSDRERSQSRSRGKGPPRR
ncbi:unnamed protein product [Periconia digitata]|uniref:RRM domain-containing protein n=1 Tax=Periconia digitata TaxID=1303443 RepID=A0A9W4UQZ1_9PLEO|nr:unnamed protein product [Periconia digitata]